MYAILQTMTSWWFIALELICATWATYAHLRYVREQSKEVWFAIRLGFGSSMPFLVRLSIMFVVNLLAWPWTLSRTAYKMETAEAQKQCTKEEWSSVQNRGWRYLARIIKSLPPLFIGTYVVAWIIMPSIRKRGLIQ